jgi:hypothetical protein
MNVASALIGTPPLLMPSCTRRRNGYDADRHDGDGDAENRCLLSHVPSPNETVPGSVAVERFEQPGLTREVLDE